MCRFGQFPRRRPLALLGGNIHDDPEKVEPAQLRWDACVELRTDEEPPPGIGMGPVGGGRYAVYRLTGPYDGIARSYGRLFGEWLPGSGESMGEGPCMELYRHALTDRAPEDLVTDLCVPLRKGMTNG